jgi:hypothetical protein
MGYIVAKDTRADNLLGYDPYPLMTAAVGNIRCDPSF